MNRTTRMVMQRMMDDGDIERGRSTPYTDRPPIENRRSARTGRYISNYSEPVYNRRMIGFDNRGSRMRYEYPMTDEMGSYGGSMERGYGNYDGYGMLDERSAKEWVKSMEHVDGTKGEHWTMDQAVDMMEKKRYNVEPVEFYVAFNMMYSDYSKVAKKMGVDTPDFYGCMADAFLNDPDAGDDKLVKYLDCITE